MSQQPPLIPEAKAGAIARQFGEKGHQWLAKLPADLQAFAAARDLLLLAPFEGGLPINLVMPAMSGGEQLVLKTGYPEPELFTEIETLKLWKGRKGCIQLVDVDEPNGIFLLERVLPGNTFRTSSQRWIRDVVHLFQDVPLQTSRVARLPRYSTWCNTAFTGFRATPADHDFLPFIERAEHFFAEIEKRWQEDWVLHGDLHHENMLQSTGDRWIAIDPKGVIGPRLLEYGRFIHNFIDDELDDANTVQSILANRTGMLAGEFDQEDLLKTGFVDLVLACTWTLNSDSQLSTYQWRLLADYAALFD